MADMSTTKIHNPHPELLMPAGSMDVLKTAVRYGAGAVYIGGEAFSLRAGARNFSPDQMHEAIEYAHAHNVKVDVTANIFAHNNDIREAEAYFKELNELRPDAVLVADPGMFRLASKYCPDVEKHISTQANNTNSETCLFWKDMGASRVVMARELSLREIREIREAVGPDYEIEAFVHGAMCISYSGRCLLSSFFTGRDANHGACAHPCRWQYSIMEMTRPGEYLPVEETERGTYIFNSKDLCMVNHLPDLYAAGIDSFKVEGRMKTALYVATVGRTYRAAMDAYEKDPALYEQKLSWFEEQIGEGTYRDFTTGFFYDKPDETAQIYNRNTYLKTATFLGSVEAYNGTDRICLTQKNKFSVGDVIEIMKPDGSDVKAVVSGIRNHEGQAVSSAPHPQESVEVSLEYMTDERPEEGDIIRRREND